MLSFILKNKLISIIFLAFFASLFFANFSFAQNNGCQIDPVGTKFRPSDALIENYNDNPMPTVYLDVKTINCNTTTTSNLLKFVFYTVDHNPAGSVNETPGIFEVALEQTGYFYMAPSSISSNPEPNSALVSSSDFSIPIKLGEEGSVGDCVYNDNAALVGGATNQPQVFGSQFLNSFLSGDIPDCMLYAKVFLKNPATPNIQDVLIHEIGNLQNPKILYECDGFCDADFLIAGNFCFPPSQQNTSNILPYGQTCPLDNSTISVTTANTQSAQTGTTGSVDFSDAPLAPLPGFDANPDLGGFLKSLFTFLIVIAGLLAFIMIIRGGITYLTSDSFGQKGNGKEYIWNAVIGLVLALGAWVILNTINPDLASDLNIAIPQVSISIGDADSFSSNDSTDQGGTITANQPLPSIGLNCPMGGGSQSVPAIIDSFVGKVTYRWGGKGGPLPSGGQFKLSPGEQENGPYSCQGPGGQVPCRSFCPDNSVCLDCSGFVNQVRRCSGLPTYSGTSSMVGSQDAVSINPSNISSNGQSVSINGQEYIFQPGDILVWNGHVVIYYGNGIIAESAGALTANTNIKKTSLSQYSSKNKITHLIKINP